VKAIYDVAAPAKLNLFLHVTGRREDGYHLLQSVLMLIDWCDSLNFERRSDGAISREDLGLRLPDEDLTVRAARALQALAGPTEGVHITLEKNIPVQAGLGGGSSDAASCLLALNRLWGLNLPLQRLESIALGLGADVPFFLRGHNAWVEGVGERISPVQLPEARFVVVKPAAGLETARVFGDPGLERDTGVAIIAGFVADPLGFGHNDLQPVAQRLCPDVASALNWLERAGLRGRMTGSGSAVFAHELRQTDWPDVPPGWQVRRCSKLEAHPLLGWATSDNS
jgi:4-diphosphocytidyl-2-C-methyl-D-erythritol kinase